MKTAEKYYKRFYKELFKYQNNIHHMNTGIMEDNIRKFEDMYNINLPYYYREWLKMNNGGELFTGIGGTVIAGIADQSMRYGNFEIADNFDVTKRLPGMPNYLFFLARTEEGDLIGYDLNHTDSMDGKVIYWDVLDKKVTSEWDNFAQWLEDEMAYWKEMIDYEGKKKK